METVDHSWCGIGILMQLVKIRLIVHWTFLLHDFYMYPCLLSHVILGVSSGLLGEGMIFLIHIA